MMKYLLPFLVVQGAYALDGKIVKMQGEVKWVNSPNGVKQIGNGDIVVAGAILKTGDKSFAKIILSDQTVITVGPKSEMEIKTAGDSNIAMVNVIAGKLRASVAEGDKSGPPKFIVKTPKVSMGVRGTDFRADYNPASGISGLLTFDGSVQIGRISEGSDGTDIFNGGASSVFVAAGQFSADGPSLSEVMSPVMINPAQMEQLKGNESFTDASDGADKKFGSAVPAGVDAKAFSADKSAVAGSLGVELGPNRIVSITSEGGVLQGGFFSEKAGYIPPPEGSRIDENTGLPIPSADAGSVDESGNYVPPAGLALTESGQFVVESTDAKLSLNDIPKVIGAAPTTELVTESGVKVPENNEPSSSTTQEPSGESSATVATSDELAAELADDILQDAIDDVTDAQNTTTSVTETSMTLSIGDVQ